VILDWQSQWASASHTAYRPKTLGRNSSASNAGFELLIVE
jgi:hypothetical protein